MIAMYREIGRFRAREFTRETDKTLYESEKNKKELEQVKTELEQVKKEKELLYNDSLYHICVDFRNAKAELEQSENELEQVEIKQQMLKEIKVIREKSQKVRKKRLTKSINNFLIRMKQEQRCQMKDDFAIIIAHVSELEQY